MTRRLRELEGLELYVRSEKGASGRIAVEENGARYFTDLGQGQKTGWYYDQRDNRAFIAGLGQRAKPFSTPIFLHRAVLHSGGQGGRQGNRVPGFSAAALALAEDSAAANQVSIRAVKADVFEEMGKTGGRAGDVRHCRRRSTAFL